MTRLNSNQTHSASAHSPEGVRDEFPAPSTTPTVLIVIVNYRTPGMTIDCLKSLQSERQAMPGLGVVVVDNASGDDSAVEIQSAIDRSGWGSWVRLIASAKNGGFSAGNNVGIAPDLASAHPADFYLLLNPDTLVVPGAVQALIDFAVKNPRAGIAGSRLENPPGVVSPSGHRFPSPLAQLGSAAQLMALDKVLPWCDRTMSLEKPEQHDWVSGASFLVRREVFDRIGLLDEGYFLYFDEVDFCMRARRAGWEVWLVPESRIAHLEGSSTQIYMRGRRKPWWYESRRRFLVKSYGVLGLIVGDALWALGRLMLVSRNIFGYGSDARLDPLHFSYDLLWGDFKAIVTGRIWRKP